MESSSFPGSSKRAKAPGNITQVAHCLVDGCNADLSLCRDYHRRHKVCETHSKTPMVTIGGREQRFCQQCSRFHSLVEFDEGKRSCRKRLDGHNRRRRKPQPDSLSTRNSGLVLFSTQQGGRLLSFNSSSPQILPTTTVLNSSWAGAVKSENDVIMLYNNHHHQQQLNYIDTQNSSLINQLQFIQNNDRPMQTLVDDPNADGALSLLSSPPAAVTREFGIRSVEAQSSLLVHNLHYNNNNNNNGLGDEYSLGEEESKAVVSTTESHASSTHSSSTLHFPEMFQHGPEGSSTTGSHQTLTFMWD